MKCEECKTLLVEAYYGELAPNRQAEIETHLVTCADCSASYRELTETLRLMDRRDLPAVEFVNSPTFWKNIESTIEKMTGNNPASNKGRTAIVHRPLFRSGWSYGIAAMLLIALGVFLGKIFSSGPFQSQIRTAGEDSSGISDSAIAARIKLDAEVGAYLDRSKVLLQGLVNAPSDVPESGNLEVQQQLSRDLVQRANYLESALKDPDQENLRKLVADLQLVLMQLANYSAENGVSLIELVKQGVDKKSILLKINLEQIRALGAPEQRHERAVKSERKS